MNIHLPAQTDIQTFADDTALSIISNSPDEIQSIANSLPDVIHKWGVSVKLNFNPAKCEAVLFTRKTEIKDINLVMNNQTIKIVKDAKYLGIFSDQKLNWHKHIYETLAKPKDLFSQ